MTRPTVLEDVYSELQDNFQKTYEALKRDLARVRTGRAHSNLLDDIRISYYGQMTPLSQVAAVNVPDARQITIKPWEANLLKDIERALLQSDLGLNPNNDGTLIRLHIPPLTEESRKKLVRQVLQLGEAAKVSARNHRRDANGTLKDLESEKEISEDDLARALKHVQKLTDDAIAKIDSYIEAKEKDLLTV
ncbi:ribosome recycling factor [Myxococcota bacterium]|nr:ribosome recycling factor [Myxococcota bacterium]MBU1431464.1 ribosome recycling factor [Myxococcota bacterium]MBU1898544.1 ribosome recycling factor [Myxococcota bacterium]